MTMFMVLSSWLKATARVHVVHFSASEVTTLWRYTNLLIIIIIII